MSAVSLHPSSRTDALRVELPGESPSGLAQPPIGHVEPKLARSGIGADELADLVRSFTEVTERLQTTHSALQSQVGQLQAELAEANEQLRRSRELAALGEMAAGIAHEIRNPLGSIALDVEMLREDARGGAVGAPGDQATICDRILRAVERLDHIVGDVLRFARDLRLQPTECEVADVLDIALHSCEAVIRRAGVTVERTGDAEGTIEADRTLIGQALTNLVRNAVEAMAEAGCGERRLRVGSRRSRRALADGRRAEHVVIRIEDSGPGVPAELLERIFHPFFTTRSEGTGLGLAIVHRIVDAHGGSIAVHNRQAAPVGGLSGGVGEPLGSGARFEIALPVRSAMRMPPRRSGTGPTARDGGRRGDGLDEAVRRRIGPLAG